jgi:hypothetical protein
MSFKIRFVDQTNTYLDYPRIKDTRFEFIFN